MKPPAAKTSSRRLFLEFLAASPLLGSAARHAFADEALDIVPTRPDPISWGLRDGHTLIKSPQEALNVFDFELVARQNVPLAHFAKVATGTDGELTMRADRADFAKVRIRPRRLRYVAKPDSSVTLFGAKWDSPIFICPTGGVKAMHPDGNIAVSKAAEIGNHLQMLAGAESVGIEDCIKARGGTPVWFQMYPHILSFEITRDIIARAERHGSPVLVLTVDHPVFPNFETLERLRREDTRDCAACHLTSTGGGGTRGGTTPNFDVITPQQRERSKQWRAANPSWGKLSWRPLDWDLVRRLRDSTKMKVVLKGILAPEDASLSVKYGFDGIIVSSHGGRAGDFGTSSISALPDIVAAVQRKISILVDSGFRRGMDVIKALAMGADAIGIGRPYHWGLGAFGQAGVERVLEILRTETMVAMAQVGASTIKDLVPELIHPPTRWIRHDSP